MSNRSHVIIFPFLVGYFVLAPQAVAQRVYYEAGPTARVDAYGNASPVWLDRRPVSIFQNDIQRQAFRSFQDEARRVNSRGGLSTFALGADAVQLSRDRRNQLLSPGSIGNNGLQNAATRSNIGYARRVPVAQSNNSRSLLKIYGSYGGFRHRVGAGQASDISMLLSRKYELLQATTLTAPVRRANMLRGGASAGSSALSNSSPILPSVEITQTDDSSKLDTGMGLDVALMASLDRQYDNAIDRGWSYFKNGEYQHASRAFETALAIESKSIEPRVAEIFCLIATGSLRTATVSLGSLTRRVESPFDISLDVREKFSTNIEARRIVLQTQIAMRANTNSSFYAPTALHVLVLWYSGDRQEAARVAKLLVRDEVPAALRNWPVLIAELLAPIQ